jgi:Na+-driven multidrug efflux pump
LFWLATLVVNVALVFAFVPVWGARGAALASTLSYALIFLLVIVYFRLRTRRAFSEALLLRRAELRALFAGARFNRVSSKRA